MVTKIIAHNFQSHKHTEVNLNNGLTVFVGDTDQGKTALVKRAFLWCLFNEPNGNAFVRYKDTGKLNSSGEREKEDLCFVTIEFDNGYILTRKRDKNKNTYELLNSDGEILCFEGFKNEVPNEIQDALSIRKFVIDEDLKFNINVIGSRDISLVDYTGNVKSKVIGAFAGTNIIDIANRGVVSDIKAVNGNIKLYQEEKLNIENKISTYSSLIEKEKLLMAIKAKIDYLDNKNAQRKNIQALSLKLAKSIEEQTKINEIITSEKEVLKAEKTLAKLEQLIISLGKTTDKKSLLNSLFEKYNNNLLQKENIKVMLNQEESILCDEKQLAVVELKIKSIIDFLEKRNKVNALLQDFNSSQENLIYCKKIINSEEKLVVYENKLFEFSDKLTDYSLKVKDFIKKKDSVNTAFSLLENVQQNLSEKKKIVVTLEQELPTFIKLFVDDIKELGTCPMCLQEVSTEHLQNIENELLEGV